jgi:hypothetical protein
MFKIHAIASPTEINIKQLLQGTEICPNPAEQMDMIRLNRSSYKQKNISISVVFTQTI